MTDDLSEAGYRQTRQKLTNMERRLADVEARTDLAPLHRERAIQSYREMMRQYLREIKLYEAKHPPREDAAPASP